jgi:hypothetical protein
MAQDNPTSSPPDARTPEATQEAQDGWLSAEQQEAARKWLDEKWTRWDCPFHGDTTWGLGSVIHGAQAWVPKGGKNIGKSYPVVVLTCNTCGYSVFINAITMGIIPPDPPDVPVQDAE